MVLDIKEQRLKTLGDYLKSRRAKLTPADVGLPPGHNQRRIPGLRREEVAQLAGVSTTWYAWVEQGRDINVSKDVIVSISRALQLNREEHLHLLRLANIPMPSPSPFRDLIEAAPLQKVLDGLVYPAMIVGYRTDILAWNAPAADLFLDFALLPDAERNMTWQIFANPLLQKRIVDWENYAKYAIGVFRGYFDIYLEDPWFPQFVEELNQVSPFFKKHWNLHDIREKTGMTLQFIRLDQTIQSFNQTSFFDINGNKDIHCCVYTPLK